MLQSRSQYSHPDKTRISKMKGNIVPYQKQVEGMSRLDLHI
jgi:hypothetical protein